MAVCERRVSVAGFAVRHRRVDGRVERAEGVGESLSVAAGQARRAPSLVVEERRVAQEDLVVAAAVAVTYLIGTIARRLWGISV